MPRDRHDVRPCLLGERRAWCETLQHARHRRDVALGRTLGVTREPVRDHLKKHPARTDRDPAILVDGRALEGTVADERRVTSAAVCRRHHTDQHCKAAAKSSCWLSLGDSRRVPGPITTRLSCLRWHDPRVFGEKAFPSLCNGLHTAQAFAYVGTWPHSGLDRMCGMKLGAARLLYPSHPMSPFDAAYRATVPWSRDVLRTATSTNYSYHSTWNENKNDESQEVSDLSDTRTVHPSRADHPACGSARHVSRLGRIRVSRRRWPSLQPAVAPSGRAAGAANGRAR